MSTDLRLNLAHNPRIGRSVTLHSQYTGRGSTKNDTFTKRQGRSGTTPATSQPIEQIWAFDVELDDRFIEMPDGTLHCEGTIDATIAVRQGIPIDKISSISLDLYASSVRSMPLPASHFSMPKLKHVGGSLIVAHGNRPIEIDQLETVGGRLTVGGPLVAPSLSQIKGGATIASDITAPRLTSIGGALELWQAAGKRICLEALLAVRGDITVKPVPTLLKSSANKTVIFEAPSLRLVQGLLRVTDSRIECPHPKLLVGLSATEFDQLAAPLILHNSRIADELRAARENMDGADAAGDGLSM